MTQPGQQIGLHAACGDVFRRARQMLQRTFEQAGLFIAVSPLARQGGSFGPHLRHQPRAGEGTVRLVGITCRKARRGLVRLPGKAQRPPQTVDQYRILSRLKRARIRRCRLGVLPFRVVQHAQFGPVGMACAPHSTVWRQVVKVLSGKQVMMHGKPCLALPSQSPCQPQTHAGRVAMFQHARKIAHGIGIPAKVILQKGDGPQRIGRITAHLRRRVQMRQGFPRPVQRHQRFGNPHMRCRGGLPCKAGDSEQPLAHDAHGLVVAVGRLHFQKRRQRRNPPGRRR